MTGLENPYLFSIGNTSTQMVDFPFVMFCFATYRCCCFVLRYSFCKPSSPQFSTLRNNRWIAHRQAATKKGGIFFSAKRFLLLFDHRQESNPVLELVFDPKFPKLSFWLSKSVPNIPQLWLRGGGLLSGGARCLKGTLTWGCHERCNWDNRRLTSSTGWGGWVLGSVGNQKPHPAVTPQGIADTSSRLSLKRIMEQFGEAWHRGHRGQGWAVDEKHLVLCWRK